MTLLAGCILQLANPNGLKFQFAVNQDSQQHEKVTEHPTSVDFAHVLRDLSNVHCAEAEKIVLVVDNLNTHKLAILNQAFEPHEIKRGEPFHG